MTVFCLNGKDHLKINLCVAAQPTSGVLHNGKFGFGNNFTFHLEFLCNRYMLMEKGMATHPSILAWKFHGQRSLVGATIHGVAKSWI